MRHADEPREEDLPAFTDALGAALDRALAAPRDEIDPSTTAAFGWGETFRRIERVWDELA